MKLRETETRLVRFQTALDVSLKPIKEVTKVKSVHMQRQVDGRPVCGAYGGHRSKRLTAEPAEVTCPRCRKLAAILP
jgi:hypothetical protein